MSGTTLIGSSGAQEQSPAARPVWQALAGNYCTVCGLHLRQLFADDSRRGKRCTAEAAGIYPDCSKNRITDETLRLLLRLTGECGLRERTGAMFGGGQINVTEKRA